MNEKGYAQPDSARLVLAVLNGLSDFGLLDGSHFEIVQYANALFKSEEKNGANKQDGARPIA
jgi:hypothetical protein